MTETETLLTEFMMLYHRATRTFDSRMAEHGVSMARTRLLLCLQKTNLQRCGELAEYFSLAPRTITEAIDGLEREGLVERRPDPEDRRAKLIIVTRAGARAVKRTEPLRRAMIEQTFGVLNPLERELMRTCLRKIGGTLDSPVPALVHEPDQYEEPVPGA